MMGTSARTRVPVSAILMTAILMVLGAAEAAALQEVTRYVRFTQNSRTYSGILEGETIQVLNGDPIFEDARPIDRLVPLSEVTLEIPVNPDRVPKVLGVAINSNNPDGEAVEVEHPAWFAKFNTSLNRNGDPVEVPFGATNFNFEGELVLIIGKGGRHIPESEALDHLFGVAVGNDYSENDWCGEGRGIEEPTYVFCKAGDSFAVLGDHVVTGLDLSDLELTVRLNGELAARGSTRDFRNPPAALISKLSHYVTLQPGDIIYTGTVAPPQLPGTRRQLWQDDVVEVQIEGIGSLSNQLIPNTSETVSARPIPDPMGLTGYVRVQRNGRWSFGVLDGSEIHELSGDPVEGRARRTGRTFNVQDVEFGIPVDPNKPGRKVIGVANNYHLPNAPPQQVPHPRFFFKLPTSLSGDGDEVQLPPESEQLIPEGELVLVIGREGRNIPTAEALDYVFGVAVGNDWTELSWGAGRGVAPQRFLAKATDTWASLGTMIVRGLDYSDLEIGVRINGSVLVEGRTSTMINHPARLISYLSRYMTLRPGDLIYTGAVPPPAGAPREMQLGDEVEVDVQGIGSLRNTIAGMSAWSERE